jgi:transposase
MRGKKGLPHANEDDPPRRRANKARGLGGWQNDRPPVSGVVGRESKGLHLQVVESVDGATLTEVVERTTTRGVTLYTDEATGYSRVAETGRGHSTVCHSDREWARDDDGDGVREVHNNTLEGIWTGLRNFLRPFRGVSKWHLEEYVAIFQWGFLCKVVGSDLIRALCGLRPITNFAP